MRSRRRPWIEGEGNLRRRALGFKRRWARWPGLVGLLLAAIVLTDSRGASSRSPQSVGFVAGTIRGRTDLAAQSGEHARFFVRRDLYSRWAAESSGGFGRLNGETFATDMGLADLRLLYLPVRFPAWQAYAAAGVGLIAHSIEQVSPAATAGFDEEGWSANAPVSVGIQFRLRDSIALEVAGGYTYTLRDDLEGAALEKGNDGFWSGGLGLVIGDFRRGDFRRRGTPPIRRLDPDAVSLDRDGDGLTDIEETRQHYTNPLMADSDGDGLDDLAEVRGGTDPNRADRDP